MIELPEAVTIARQAAAMLLGRTVTDVFNATYSHKFTWFLGDPSDYRRMLVGRTFVSAAGHGAFADLCLNGDVHIAVSDGVNLRYCAQETKIPAKYQLLITLDDGSFLVFTVAMYGGINVFEGAFDHPYYQNAVTKPSPLGDRFDAAYFNSIASSIGKSLSVKAFLATEQRIPGLGNGALQDILFRARIHPKRKLATLDERERTTLFETVRSTLSDMVQAGGRDTEKDLFGNPGGYRTLLSRNTIISPCPVCGGGIVRENYMGGAVYFCPACQPLK